MLILTVKDGHSIRINDIQITVYSQVEDIEGERLPNTVELEIDLECEVVRVE